MSNGDAFTKSLEMYERGLQTWEIAENLRRLPRYAPETPEWYEGGVACSNETEERIQSVLSDARSAFVAKGNPDPDYS